MTHETINSGAIPALRGFRTQFLYTLYRILISEGEEVIYPELEEDYSIRKHDALMEVAQVKNQKSPLTLSNLSSKRSSLFERSLLLIKSAEVKSIRIVSFGELGSDLLNLQNKEHTETIVSKLNDLFGFETTDSIELIKRLNVIKVNEAALSNEVLSLLRETLVAVDPGVASDILLFWLYKIAESNLPITRSALVEKIEVIGQFLTERYEFLREFGSAITSVRSHDSLNDLDTLTQEFFSGISAKYDHVLNQLDIIRPEKLKDLDCAFSESNVVILHGASGQGKSTLAYRFIHGRFPDGYAYEIKSITGLAHVLTLSQAIKALSRPFDTPFLILIDVMPGDTNWVELVKRLSELPRCQILVTIREEDLNRSASLYEFVASSQVKLGLSVDEASQIYNQFTDKEGAIPNFLNFNDAWSKFDSGPLLEFAFFLRKGERLRDKLKNQLARIGDEAVDQADLDQIKLLRYVAVAGAHDCRIDLRQMLNILNLSSSQRTISYFENEYLVRISDGGRIVEALHPVRASIMAEELCDAVIEPVSENLEACLPLIVEEDIGNYILQYTYSFGLSENMMRLLKGLKFTSWKSCKDTLTSLIWCGVNEYIKRNKEKLEQLKLNYPYAYEIAVLMHIAPSVDLTTLDKYLNNDLFKNIKNALTELDPIEDFYLNVKPWLYEFKSPNDIAISNDSEIKGLGYLLFWLGHFNIHDKIAQNVLERLENLNLNEISLDATADLLLGLQHANLTCKKIADRILPQFFREFQILEQVTEIEDDQERVKIHFFFDLAQFASPENETNPFHEKTLRLIRLIRRAIPFRKTYSSQGYGHRIQALQTFPDNTCKNIPLQNLPLPWITEANGFFLNLLKWNDRPEDWSPMMQSLISTKKHIVRTLNGIVSYVTNISKDTKIQVIEAEIPSAIIEGISGQLPKAAVDKWGFTGDNLENEKADQVFHKVPLLLLIEPNLKPSFKAVDDFISHIRNFIAQSTKSLVRKGITQSWSSKDLNLKEALLRDSGYPLDIFRLSKFNLTESFEKLTEYEKGFNQILELHSIPIDSQISIDLKSTLDELCLLWPYFLEQKKYQIQDIRSQSKLKEDLIIKEFENKLHSRLRNLKSNNIIEDYEFINAEEDKSQSFIFLYIKRWEQYLTTWDKIKSILIQSLEPCPMLSFKRLVLERKFSTIWIIPLYEDYLLSRTAIKISLYNILDSTEAFKLSMIGTVSDEMITHLEIDEASKAFLGFGNPERFIGLVQTIGMTIHHLAQLEVLYGRNEVGNLLLSAHSTKMIIDTYAQFKEVDELISILFEDIELELKSTSPIIQDEILIEYVLSMREQIAKLFALDGINEPGNFDPKIFKLFVEIDLNLKDGNELLMIVYWTWLEIMIKKHLWN